MRLMREATHWGRSQGLTAPHVCRHLRARRATARTAGTILRRARRFSVRNQQRWFVMRLHRRVAAAWAALHTIAPKPHFHRCSDGALVASATTLHTTLTTLASRYIDARERRETQETRERPGRPIGAAQVQTSQR